MLVVTYLLLVISSLLYVLTPRPLQWRRLKLLLQGSYSESRLQFAVFDLIESKKADEVFDRSTLIPRAHLTSISISAKADGTASESYAFEGDILEIYRKPFHDLVSLAGTRTT
jgi:hypothetical protein